MQQICYYVLLFFIYSFCGWILEVICKFMSHHKFINRGFFIGLYCPIYGIGAIFITFLLKRYLNDAFTLFVMTMLLCSILEYATSYFLEKIFKTRWWDYSSYRFHINGRICLETMIPFGLFGLFIMYLSNPFFLYFIEQIPLLNLYIISFVLLFIFLFDAIFSFQIMASFQSISSNIRTDSTEKITAFVKKVSIKEINIIKNVYSKHFLN